jgi:hypothetical protein
VYSRGALVNTAMNLRIDSSSRIALFHGGFMEGRKCSSCFDELDVVITVDRDSLAANGLAAYNSVCYSSNSYGGSKNYRKK